MAANTFLLFACLSFVFVESFTNIDSSCSFNEQTSTCPTPSASNPFSCTLLTSNKCGCDESSIISNVIFIIDNTGFTNDYSWYYWSIEWIKLYQTKILINQPSITHNLTYIHIGDDTSNYVITPNVDNNGHQINPNTIFNSWTIPNQYKDNNSPNFCASIEAAINIIDIGYKNDKSTVIVYLANLTPSLPNNDTSCQDYLGASISNILSNKTSIYMLRSSPNVNIKYVENEFSDWIGLDMTMNNEYIQNVTDNWGSTYNSSSNSMTPNYKLVSQYMNNIIATSSDFICENSYLCDTILYKSSNDTTVCEITCNTMNDSCVTDIDSSS